MAEKKSKILSELFSTSSGLKIVEIYDDNTGISFLMKSVILKVKDEMRDSIDFTRLDIRETIKCESPKLLFPKPVCLLMKSGNIVEVFNGLVSSDKIVSTINKYI